MPSTCVFEFDRPEPVYYSGEIIRARIQLNTTSDKSVNSVYLEFTGEAKVRWQESRSRTRNGKTEHYTEYFRATETYLNQRTTVFNGSTLPMGLHTYTFEIPLPIQCPTSCSEEYGHIRYELALIIDRPYKFDNEFKQPLTVIKQLNLNLSPEYAFPCTAEEIKYFCCWCCASDPVIATLTIPFGGYAPGQKIKYTLQLDNQSNYDLDGLELKFKQEYKFVAHTPRHKTRYHDNTLAKTVQGIDCLRLTKRILEGELIIPSVPPSSSDNGIITVSYNLKMILDCGACHNDSELIIPITIGTVPLAQSATDPSHASWIQPVQPPTAPNMTPDDVNSDKPPSYELYKPPSFEESTNIGGNFIDIDVNEHNRVDDFIPKYPMYTNFAIPSAPPPCGNAPADASESVQQPLLSSNPKCQEANGDPPPYSSTVAPYPTGPTTSGGAPSLPYPANPNATGDMPSLPSTSTSGYGWAN